MAGHAADRLAADHLAIDHLVRRYADIATRQAWDEYAGIVLPEATVTFHLGGGEHPDIVVTGPDGLAELGRTAMRAFAFYVYAPLNNVVTQLDGDVASGRAHALESMVDHEGAWVDVYGGYDDTFRRVAGRWMIAGRRYRQLRRQER